MALLPPRERTQQILALGVPISLGMVSQSLLSLVDVAMVAQLNDTHALGAVGVGSFASFLAVSLVLGIAAGVQATVARRLGEDSSANVLIPLNGGLLVAIVTGLVLTVLFLLATPTIIHMMNDNPAVQRIGQDYLYYRVISIVLVGINFAYRGFWNGIGQSMTMLKALLVVHFSNFFFTYCLIFGAFGFPELGAPGSGLGTSLSLLVGTLFFTVMTLIKFPKRGFMRLFPERGAYKKMLSLAIPNSLQQFFGAVGVSIFITILGKISVDALAVGHAITNISLFLILPGSGLGLAATTLVSRALGGGKVDEAYRWGWEVTQTAFPFLLIMGAPLVLFPEQILSLFLPTDPALIELGRLPLQITGATACLQAFTLALPQALYGAGSNKQVLWVSLSLQYLISLPLCWYVGLHLGYGLIGIWLVALIERFAGISIYSTMWRRKHWAKNIF